MNKQSVIEFFDRLAPGWDDGMVRDDFKIGRILDFAGVFEGVSVLDVACGTGVLVPDYLARNVEHIAGVDISPAMIDIAKAKFCDPRVTFINGDIEELSFDRTFDCCVIYNAFPHFLDPGRLIKTLSGLLGINGRLTIAHGMSRDDINAHHSGGASEVSLGLPDEVELSEMMGKFLHVDVVLSDDEMFVVSGRL